MTSNELEIFKQSILDDVRVMMQTTGQVTQYIGARYVPLFAEPFEWDINKEYEPLTIVTNQGNSFTSRQFVPKGIELTNEQFWVETGNFNAQIEQYRQEVKILEAKVNENTNSLDNILKNTPEYYGAYGDGVHDDTDAFKRLITEHNAISLTPNKIYIIDNLVIDYQGPLTITGNGATIKTKATFALSLNTEWPSETYNLININDVVFDGNDKGCVKVESFACRVHFNCCSFINIRTYGFYNITRKQGFEYIFDNCYFGNNEYVEGTAIYLDTSDAVVNNCVFQNFKVAVYSFGLNILSKLHIWVSGALSRKGTTGIVVGYNEVISDIYFDSIETCIELHSNASGKNIEVNNSTLLTKDEEEVNYRFIDNKGASKCTFFIVNLNVIDPNESAKFTIKDNVYANLKNINAPASFFSNFATPTGEITSIESKIFTAKGSSILTFTCTVNDFNSSTPIFNIPTLIAEQGIAIIYNASNEFILNRFTSGYYSLKNIPNGEYNVKVIG